MHFNWHLCALLFCFAAATLPISICGTGAVGGEIKQRYPKNASTSTAITEENNQNDEQGKLNNHWKMFFYPFRNSFCPWR
jgi:hypothetical protein